MARYCGAYVTSPELCTPTAESPVLTATRNSSPNLVHQVPDQSISKLFTRPFTCNNSTERKPSTISYQNSYTPTMPFPEPVRLEDETEEERRLRQENRERVTRLETEAVRTANEEITAAEAQVDASRKLAAKEADRQMEAERQRRIVEAEKGSIQEELLKKQNIEKAIALEEQEQRRRVLETNQSEEIGLAIRRTCGKAVDEWADQEKARRSIEDLSSLPAATRTQKEQIGQEVVREVQRRRSSASERANPQQQQQQQQGSAYTYGAGAGNESQIPRSAGAASAEQQQQQQARNAQAEVKVGGK
ncbi:uncharacterized protein EV422DRAFT_527931 [Fimicolochytrium jonesii]|uniref:uncharacterized protein n=1 Tax=Fimicolochytrium jonesii TaxID=1396493 RepID=UPI0022FEA6B3|nr:uncharacterized protein EV422DRAFT_527931 [Fimicolochytrium jonesii]KAI8821364.1 hypothetical protein EV422DRAFT_527931 [Fimicolochytrium jonesii]